MVSKADISTWKEDDEETTSAYEVACLIDLAYADMMAPKRIPSSLMRRKHAFKSPEVVRLALREAAESHGSGREVARASDRAMRAGPTCMTGDKRAAVFAVSKAGSTVSLVVPAAEASRAILDNGNTTTFNSSCMRPERCAQGEPSPGCLLAQANMHSQHPILDPMRILDLGFSHI